MIGSGAAQHEIAPFRGPLHQHLVAGSHPADVLPPGLGPDGIHQPAQPLRGDSIAKMIAEPHRRRALAE
jgi:hypothetical protein